MTERNADPELVSLAILDSCERAARGFPANYTDPLNKDAQFMTGSVQNWQSRIEVLKLQAAAGWKPEFQSMLSNAHSICVEAISYPEKESVRTKKMRCMACGRWEKRCKFGINAVGPFDASGFNCEGAAGLEPAWRKFWTSYKNTLLAKDVKGKLHCDDMGLYSIGETCMKKAQVFYLLNTLLLNEVFEASFAASKDDPDDDEWVHATEEQAEVLLERFNQLQNVAADEKRAVPSWGTDRTLWKKIDESRMSAAQGDQEFLAKMLRKRAQGHIGARRDSEDQEDQEDQEDSGSDSEPHQLSFIEINRTKSTRKRVAALEESESDGSDGSDGSGSEGMSDFIVEDGVEDGVEDSNPAKKPGRPGRPGRASARKQKARPVAVRKSRRVLGKSPTSPEAEGPHEEGVEPIDPVESVHLRPSRAPPKDPFRVAQARRAPEGRLPARRECLLQLIELQMNLVREGRDGDASVCTNAIMTLQELLARVEQLSHTA